MTRVSARKISHQFNHTYVLCWNNVASGREATRRRVGRGRGAWAGREDAAGWRGVHGAAARAARVPLRRGARGRAGARGSGGRLPAAAPGAGRDAAAQAPDAARVRAAPLPRDAARRQPVGRGARGAEPPRRARGRARARPVRVRRVRRAAGPAAGRAPLRLRPGRRPPARRLGVPAPQAARAARPQGALRAVDARALRAQPGRVPLRSHHERRRAAGGGARLRRAALPPALGVQRQVPASDVHPAVPPRQAVARPLLLRPARQVRRDGQRARALARGPRRLRQPRALVLRAAQRQGPHPRGGAGGRRAAGGGVPPRGVRHARAGPPPRAGVPRPPGLPHGVPGRRRHGPARLRAAPRFPQRAAARARLRGARLPPGDPLPRQRTRRGVRVQLEDPGVHPVRRAQGLPPRAARAHHGGAVPHAQARADPLAQGGEGGGTRGGVRGVGGGGGRRGGRGAGGRGRRRGRGRVPAGARTRAGGARARVRADPAAAAAPAPAHPRGQPPARGAGAAAQAGGGGRARLAAGQGAPVRRRGPAPRVARASRRHGRRQAGAPRAPAAPRHQRPPLPRLAAHRRRPAAGGAAHAALAQRQGRQEEEEEQEAAAQVTCAPSPYPTPSGHAHANKLLHHLLSQWRLLPSLSLKQCTVLLRSDGISLVSTGVTATSESSLFILMFLLRISFFELN